MHDVDLSSADWRKSSHSSGEGQCVQIAANVPGMVAVRDSKDPDGPKLIFTSAEWAAFIHRVKRSRPLPP